MRAFRSLLLFISLVVKFRDPCSSPAEDVLDTGITPAFPLHQNSQDKAQVDEAQMEIAVLVGPDLDATQQFDNVGGFCSTL